MMLGGGKLEQSTASPAARASRRRSFSRRSLPQIEERETPVKSDQNSSSALVNSIFRAADDALTMVSKELNLSRDEVATMKTRLRSVEERLGSRDGPVESACRSMVLLQEGLCPPKRMKTDSAEDSYHRTLQQTLNDWDLTSVQNLLSEMTALEPLPPIDEASDSTSSPHYEDILERQLQSTEQLLAGEVSFHNLMRGAASHCLEPPVSDRYTTPGKFMERFGFHEVIPNKVA